MITLQQSTVFRLHDAATELPMPVDVPTEAQRLWTSRGVRPTSAVLVHVSGELKGPVSLWGYVEYTISTGQVQIQQWVKLQDIACIGGVQGPLALRVNKLAPCFLALCVVSPEVVEDSTWDLITED